LRSVFKTKNHPATWAALSLAKLIALAASLDLSSTREEREEVEMWAFNTCVTATEQSSYDWASGATGAIDGADADFYLATFGAWVFCAALDAQEAAGA
jgi:hypothetical protein